MTAHESENGGSGPAPSPRLPLSRTDPGVLAHPESLLRSASVLLAKEAHLPAVYVLHCEILRALGHSADSLRPYNSRRDAEQRHRKLLDCYSKAHKSAQFSSHLTRLRLRLPEWASWTTILLLTVGLTLRYAWAVASRTNWAQQHPEGNWVSRYYPKHDFQGYPLVRYDVGVDYDWGSGAPAQAMARDHWSARWDTCVIVTSDVDLNLRLSADDSARLVVDEMTLLEVVKPGRAEGKVTLRQGTRHVRVDFQEKQGSARIRLEGINFEGTDLYNFERPELDGDTVRCH